jgi:hypothetical protein
LPQFISYVRIYLVADSNWSACALAESYLKRFLATFLCQLNHVEQRYARFAAIYYNMAHLPLVADPVHCTVPNYT